MTAMRGGTGGRCRAGLGSGRGSWGDGGIVGIITERASAADGYEPVPVPVPDQATPDKAALPKAALHTVTESGGGGVILRRRSAQPTRRSVLYLHWDRDTFVPEDLVSWYTERGFHFYVADLRPQDQLAAEGRGGRGPARATRDLAAARGGPGPARARAGR